MNRLALVFIGFISAVVIILLYGYFNYVAWPLPDLNEQHLKIACWTDDTTICRNENGILVGILPDYYREACSLLNCTFTLIPTTVTSAVGLIVSKQVDGTLAQEDVALQLDMEEAEIPVLTQRYGIAMRADSKYSELEDVISNKQLIIAIRPFWNMPQIRQLFSKHNILEDWLLQETADILLRGQTDLFIYTGVEFNGKIRYETISEEIKILDGNPIDQISIYPGFANYKELVPAFDIATAILLYNGKLNESYAIHYAGIEVDYRGINVP